MTSSAMSYRGSASGRTYTLGPLVARGGEGRVFVVSNQPDKVAKIYSNVIDDTRIEKLDTLIKLKQPPLTSVSAWPLEILVDANKKAVGFVMPAISGGKPLHMFMTPSDRQQHAPHVSYSMLICIAANLARATGNFHVAGVVLADVNCSNILVLPDATVRVIDCDSVQIGKSAKFRSAVAMEDFVPPELQGKRVADHARTTDHDNFGLAVLVFQLLVMGRHPFSGNGSIPLGTAIARRLHPFVKRCSRTCPFCMLGIEPDEILSAQLRSLFAVAFGGGKWHSGYRPVAHEWMHALESFSRQLVTCTANPTHGYSRTAKACPWCRMEVRGLPPMFAPTPRQRLPSPPRRRKGLLARLFG